MKFLVLDDIIVGTATGNVAGIEAGPFEALDINRLRFDGTAIVDVSDRSNWHVDKFGVRHILAAAGRQPLTCHFTDEIEPDGAGGWRVVDQLARLKGRRKAAIDAEAERQRERWITPGAGQAMTYLAKIDEARALTIDPEDPDPQNYPLLSAEVGITAPTLPEVADIVRQAYQQWLQIGGAIERARRAGKQAVELAEDLAAVEAVTVTWPNP